MWNIVLVLLAGPARLLRPCRFNLRPRLIGKKPERRLHFGLTPLAITLEAESQPE
jgi:hypothetical protein